MNKNKIIYKKINLNNFNLQRKKHFLKILINNSIKKSFIIIIKYVNKNKNIHYKTQTFIYKNYYSINRFELVQI